MHTPDSLRSRRALYYRGNCDQNSQYIPLLFGYARKHQLRTGSLLIEMLCTDIHTSALPQEQLTQLQLMLQDSVPSSDHSADK